MQALRILTFRTVMALLIVSSEVKAQAPSFDCGKALTSSETLICNDPGLATAEKTMADLYSAVLRQTPSDEKLPFRHEHYEWFNEYRITCNTAMPDEDRRTCIQKALGERTAQLRQQLEEPHPDGRRTTKAQLTPQGQSKIEEVFPKDFDYHHYYKTFDYDSLVDHIEASYHVTNTFVGERVKVIAFYNSQIPPGLYNRSRLTVGQYGCFAPLCDRLENIFSEDAGALSLKTMRRLVGNITPLLYFRDPGQYAAFLATARKDSFCTTLNPCYVLAAGVLHTTTVEYHTVLGLVLHKDLIYMDVDKVSLFKASGYVGAKMIAKGFWTGIKLGSKIYSFGAD